MKDLRVVITFPYILSILKEERRKWDNLIRKWYERGIKGRTDWDFNWYERGG